MHIKSGFHETGSRYPTGTKIKHTPYLHVYEATNQYLDQSTLFCFFAIKMFFSIRNIVKNKVPWKRKLKSNSNQNHLKHMSHLCINATY